MTRLRILLSRAADLLLRRRRDARLDDELEGHFELLLEQYRAQGMDKAQARRAARQAFGDMDEIRMTYREQRGVPAVDLLLQDVRLACRQMARHPGFAVIGVLILGLGIGVNNMFFTILYAHTIRGLPIAGVDRVLSVSARDDRTPNRGFSYPDFDDLRRQSTSLEGLAAYMTAPVIVGDAERAPERIDGAFVSSNTFDVLGIRPLVGRLLDAADEHTNAQVVVVLGQGIWRARYDGDPHILGRTILVNGTPATVVGIVPERSGFPSTAEVWLPLAYRGEAAREGRTGRDLMLLGRVRDEMTIAAARAEMEANVERLAQAHPDVHSTLRAHAIPINERFLGRLTEPVWIAFMTAGCLVLLISCANVANLLLARSVHRAREVAVRRALGASRRRIIRQLLTEGAVLSALGGVFGLMVGTASLRLFSSAIPQNVLPYWIDYSPDARILGTLMGVSVATVFISALAPALHTARADVNGVLKSAAYTTVTGSGQRWSAIIFAAELALAVLLLAQLAVNIRTVAPDIPAESALDTKDVVTAAITLPAAQYVTADRRIEFFDSLQERLNGQSGISAAFTSALPLSGAERRPLEAIRRRGSPDEDAPSVATVAISAGYFRTLGITLLAGRAFERVDGDEGRAYAVVNESFVRAFLADVAPMGQRITLGARSGSAAPSGLTIVGIAPDIRQRPSGEPEPVVYLPLRHEGPVTAWLMTRSGLPAERLVPLLRSEVQALDPHLPLHQVRVMAQVTRDAAWNGRVAGRLFMYLTTVAVVLTTLGLFVVTAHSVSLRTREIGLRMAVGAGPRQIAAFVLRRVAVQIATGFAAGVACAKLWAWIFSSGRPGVTATDPGSLAIVALVLAGMALVACSVPTARAMRMQAVAALRAGDP